MRLILSSRPPRGRGENAPDLCAFSSIEDFSVGPLSSWPDRQQFAEERAGFWARSDMWLLPDGTHMPYQDYLCVSPHYSMEELIGMSDDAVPEILAPKDVLGRAASIELWVGHSVKAELWFWQVLSDLTAMAVDPGRVFFSRIDDDVFWDEGRSAAMFDDGADGQAIPKADWAAALTAWDAVTSGALDWISVNNQVFEVLAGRRMDPLTGLNNIRRRLLAAARPEWMKMARVVGEAMAAGYDMRDDAGDTVPISGYEGF